MLLKYLTNFYKTQQKIDTLGTYFSNIWAHLQVSESLIKTQVKILSNILANANSLILVLVAELLYSQAIYFYVSMLCQKARGCLVVNTNTFVEIT